MTSLQTKQGTPTLGNFTYAYARDGQVTRTTGVVQGGATRTAGYGYDGLGRLAQAAETAGTTDTYDARHRLDTAAYDDPNCSLTSRNWPSMRSIGCFLLNVARFAFLDGSD